MVTSQHSAWIGGVFENLDRAGPEGAAAAAYIRRHGTRLSVHDQTTGARWTADRRIEIHPRYAALATDDPYAISLIIHEVRHLEQGVITALSVYGELDAWQLQFRFLMSATGHYHPNEYHNSVIGALMKQPLGWDRAVLRRVRYLMQVYAGKAYRVDLLPLYPLHRELVYRLT